MKGALGQMMRQAQQMQENLKKAQDEVARLEVTGESGAGLVKVSLTGSIRRDASRFRRTRCRKTRNFSKT